MKVENTVVFEMLAYILSAKNIFKIQSYFKLFIIIILIGYDLFRLWGAH